ncbi:MAG: hypothetical protein ACQEW2_17765 [Bacillota bacterium]
MQVYKDQVLQEDNLVYSFFGDYNIVIAKESLYNWMGKSSSESLYYVLVERDMGPDRQEIVHLKVFMTIGLTLKYLSVILQEYIYDLTLIERIKNITNQLAFEEISKV